MLLTESEQFKHISALLLQDPSSQGIRYHCTQIFQVKKSDIHVQISKVKCCLRYFYLNKITLFYIDFLFVCVLRIFILI